MASCALLGCPNQASGSSPFCSLDCMEAAEEDGSTAQTVSPQMVAEADVTFAFGPEERSTEVVECAAKCFRDHGLCILKDCIPPEVVERSRHVTMGSLGKIQESLAARGLDMNDDPFSFREIVHRSHYRYDMQLAKGVSPLPLDEASLEEQAPWVPIVQQVLGEDAQLLFSGAVISGPGAEAQDCHRDGYQIPGHDAAHCLTVFVPLVTVNKENRLGSTQFWPGTHIIKPEHFRDVPPTFAPDYELGSVLLFDYRLFHRGVANEGDARRPMLYLVWAKPWYKENNFPGEPLCASDQ